ncbi:MAG: hypothetical protein GWN58_43400 [Anaerolineae bacterium]|nr:hypothetical protein [Anaerolineae bacterium]
MNGPGFTRRQRLTVLLLVVLIVVVLAMTVGFIVTSIQSWERATPATLQPSPSQLRTPVSSPSPAPTPLPTPEEGIWSQVQAARLFDQIAHQVETLRGLSPRAEVPLSFLDEREMATLLRQRYVERSLEAQIQPYIALGLLPDASISIDPREAAGVYIPDQEQLYVAIGQQEVGADDQALLGHAYAHALQDQHFDLGAMDARATSIDAALAVQALVEGDAALLTALYRHEDLTVADWRHLEGLILEAEQPGYGEALDRSEVWARLQRFPYREGRRFAEALFQAGGWEAVNRAYADPPRSTEQVLHPERYLGAPGERDEPTQVVVPELGAILGEDWRMLLQGTLGEFVVGLYLDLLLPEEVSWEAADGWDGDTFTVWDHEDGRRVLVWRTIWDSTAEAVEFEHALFALIPQRYLPAWPVDPPRGLTGRWWTTDAGAVSVSRVARYVIFARAPDVNALANVMGMLP